MYSWSGLVRLIFDLTISNWLYKIPKVFNHWNSGWSLCWIILIIRLLQITLTLYLLLEALGVDFTTVLWSLLTIINLWQSHQFLKYTWFIFWYILLFAAENYMQIHCIDHITPLTVIHRRWSLIICILISETAMEEDHIEFRGWLWLFSWYLIQI